LFVGRPSFDDAAHLHIEEVRMSAPSQADGVAALIEPLARDAGLVLESVTVTPAGKRRVLRVIVDLPPERTGGVPMEAVATASQAISAALDQSPVMGGQPYTLEVSSPGTDRPLTERRHWMRARGRLVTVVAATGVPAGQVPQAAGRLIAVTDSGITLDSGPEIGWELIGSGRIEVEFGHPSALDDLAEDDAAEEDDDEEDEDDDETNPEGEG
jgi:ribosome maturation factor RimP